MRIPAPKTILVSALVAAIGVGFFFFGRLSVNDSQARNAGYQSGRTDGYFDGVKAGEAQGLQEGRALQAGSAVAGTSQQPVQDAFNRGYAAGENDAFGDYDGGWQTEAPYLVIVVPGSGAANTPTYRISTRTLLRPDTDYYLCPDSPTICSGARH
jgi:hypothetical protein